MASTTKGFRYPVSSDAPDVPTDLLNLATDVDTKVGLFLLNSTSFSALQDVSLDNVFTSAYRNYKIIVNFTSAPSTTQPVFRLRTGATNSITSYNWNYHYYSTAPSFTGFQGAGTTSWSLGVCGTGGGTGSINMDVYNPQLAVNTSFSSTGEMRSVTYGTVTGGGQHLLSTSYDGFTLSASIGTTLTGKVYVYGYNGT